MGIDNMPNKILRIVLKPKDKRSIGELLAMVRFYRNCTSQQFKYAMGLEYYFTNKFTN